mmetsp:Transcript_14070/g.22164  ORF Transcript_14070/g.22164 Transcript_14070/m.22164 type:complete len:143 (-) Transcript_14070:244-672(-)|eukprot:CAMPEP_0116999744 /NCGR_PEP_ID=MMETSP0472-20121206/2345_1 /TAXON_ID=693140 ORGANISM="Tiarina fusus, Strain LIS" /NCGR_SAMPLE_ID=MMETSP0472 /ASSEMBLY_ACC=CAM_ASM_000603 /LENGTH=142 /DNA_ID=CAMNT_0004699261 /DNA_START=82 /DNA_END=510 /DNA_ORIENTATION=+
MFQQTSSSILRQLVCLTLLSVGLAFAPLGSITTTTTSTPTRLYDFNAGVNNNGGSGNGGIGNLEILEFKIYDDGRVEETVRGVKGGNCHKVTEGINEMLGNVVATEPTEELYEQEIVLEQTLTESVSDSSSSSSTWEGSSSW